MHRQARHDVPGALHHVIVRGMERGKYELNSEILKSKISRKIIARYRPIKFAPIEVIHLGKRDDQ